MRCVESPILQGSCNLGCCYFYFKSNVFQGLYSFIDASSWPVDGHRVRQRHDLPVRNFSISPHCSE